jgi:hypothetical protein
MVHSCPVRRAGLLFVGLAAACSAFRSGNSSNPNGDGNRVADASADQDSPLAAPAFVGSRTSAPANLLSPAGVRPNDVLVSAWLSGPDSVQLPSDWIELGRTSVGNPENGGAYTLVVGYHVLSEAENDGTTYAFEGSGGQVVTVAYRNASLKQPVTPLNVTSIQSQAVDGGVAALDVPPLDTRGVTLPLYVFAIEGSTTFPIIPGLERVEVTNDLAAYSARTASPAANTVAGPHLEIPFAGAAPDVMVASLAMVAGP